MMLTFKDNVALFKRRLGMYVMNGTYSEVCALIDGLDLASGQEVMTGFRNWMLARGVARPELSWWFLVLGVLYPGGQVPNVIQFSEAENGVAIATLFELLDDYLRECP